MLLTALLALILTVLPLPATLALVRPMFLVLTVLYWSIASPRAGGIALGFFSGLMLDVFQSPVLGEHALRAHRPSLLLPCASIRRSAPSPRFNNP